MSPNYAIIVTSMIKSPQFVGLNLVFLLLLEPRGRGFLMNWKNVVIVCLVI